VEKKDEESARVRCSVARFRERARNLRAPGKNYGCASEERTSLVPIGSSEQREAGCSYLREKKRSAGRAKDVRGSLTYFGRLSQKACSRLT